MKIVINMKIVNVYKELISESGTESMVERIIELLDASYQPKIGVTRHDALGEYHKKPVIINRIDGEVIEIDNLIDYIGKDFNNLDYDFIKQVIYDWGNGVVKKGKYQLSKNVPM